MNDLVKTSIESRKTAIFNAYKITDQNLINKIEDLFNRINEFGETCADNMDFETKFATSELNQEYINLFTEIATSCPQKTVQSVENREVKSDAEYVLEDVASEVKYQVDDATMPMRRQMREEAERTARNTPVIGEIMEAKQYADLFGKFFKKKKKDEDKEDDEKKWFYETSIRENFNGA